MKNRVHIDLAPRADDQAAEVAGLEAVGAVRVDVRQDAGDVTWVVLADPEVNEFCVLSPRDQDHRHPASRVLGTTTIGRLSGR